MKKLLIIPAIVAGIFTTTYALDTAAIDKEIAKEYPMYVKDCESKNHKESCLGLSSELLVGATMFKGNEKQYITNKAVTYYNKACANTKNASSDMKQLCPMIYKQIKQVQKSRGYARSIASEKKLTLGSCAMGMKVYLKKLKARCGMGIGKFARQNYQNEWESLAYPTKFLNEIVGTCGDIDFENIPTIKKHLSDIYSMVYKYARDSGNVVSYGCSD